MTRLRDHIEAPLDEARLERQWSALSGQGLPSSASPLARGLRWALGGALAMAAVGGLALQLQTAPGARVEHAVATPTPAPVVATQHVPTGAVLEADESEVAVQLRDGSEVALAPRAQMRVRSNRPKVVEPELQGGQARFDVRHDTTRRFAIRIGEAEVRVLGTRFDLERQERADSTFVRVSVQEGVVEVERVEHTSRQVARIHAGESWSATFEHKPAQAEEIGTSPQPKPSKPKRAAAAPPSASELFGQASLARRAGRMREAAQSYAELLELHPRDARAGLSAFELGRLRMDALGDSAGAIEALERALTSGTSASFREDALARIVIATDALGRTQQCLRARERYEKQYPRGVHKSALSQRCK